MKSYWIKVDTNNRKLNSMLASEGWQQLNGKEFYSFIKSAKAHGRYFITVGSYDLEDSDIIVIESNKDEYIKWRKEKRHSQYLKENGREIISLPFSAFGYKSQNEFVEQIFDEGENIEDKVQYSVLLEHLKIVMDKLSPEERMLLNMIYFAKPPLTGREISRRTGIPQKTISNRIRAILKKLKIFMAQI